MILLELTLGQELRLCFDAMLFLTGLTAGLIVGDRLAVHAASRDDDEGKA